jgi:FMN reductase
MVMEIRLPARKKERELTDDQRLTPVVRVIGLSGSLREGSYTRMAIKLALSGASEIGVETELVDLRTYDLAFADGRKDGSSYPPDVHRLRATVRDAQGIILGTPEYHGGLSGTLKNAIDLMGFDEFEGKVVGLIGVSGGKMGALNALMSLRTIGRSLHAWVIPEQVSIAEGWRLFDAQGRLKDAGLMNALTGLGKQVARFAFLHSSEQVREFVRLWEGAPANPGGGRG